MLNAASNLRKHVLDKFYTDEAIVDVPISIDGSWQKWCLTLCLELFCYYPSMVVSKVFYAPLKSANSDIPLVGDSSSFGSVLASVNAQYGDMRLKGKIALVMYKNSWALHYVVIKINDGMQFYLMRKVLAVKDA